MHLLPFLGFEWTYNTWELRLRRPFQQKSWIREILHSSHIWRKLGPERWSWLPCFTQLSSGRPETRTQGTSPAGSCLSSASCLLLTAVSVAALITLSLPYYSIDLLGFLWNLPPLRLFVKEIPQLYIAAMYCLILLESWILGRPLNGPTKLNTGTWSVYIWPFCSWLHGKIVFFFFSSFNGDIIDKNCRYFRCATWRFDVYIHYKIINMVNIFMVAYNFTTFNPKENTLWRSSIDSKMIVLK